MSYSSPSEQDHRDSTSSKLLQLRLIPIEHIRVTAIIIAICIPITNNHVSTKLTLAKLIFEHLLPERIERPAALRIARLIIPARHVQRTGIGKSIRVVGALFPPRRARIQNRIAAAQVVVTINEFLDPFYGCAVALKVEHAYESQRKGLSDVLGRYLPGSVMPSLVQPPPFSKKKSAWSMALSSPWAKW